MAWYLSKRSAWGGLGFAARDGVMDPSRVRRRVGRRRILAVSLGEGMCRVGLDWGQMSVVAVAGRRANCSWDGGAGGGVVCRRPRLSGAGVELVGGLAADWRWSCFWKCGLNVSTKASTKQPTSSTQQQPTAAAHCRSLGGGDTLQLVASLQLGIDGPATLRRGGQDGAVGCGNRASPLWEQCLLSGSAGATKAGDAFHRPHLTSSPSTDILHIAHLFPVFSRLSPNTQTAITGRRSHSTLAIPLDTRYLHLYAAQKRVVAMCKHGL